jgi:hypothetical protein
VKKCDECVPKQEIFLQIQESSQILLDQKPQRQRDIGLVPFDLARHQTHGLHSRLIEQRRGDLEMNWFAFRNLQLKKSNKVNRSYWITVKRPV